MIASYRLWNLWEMLKIYAHEYLDLGRAIERIATTLMLAERSEGEEKKLTAGEQKEFASEFAKLAKQCEALGLPVSTSLAKTAVNDVPRTQRELATIFRVVKQELSGQLFLFVPTNRAVYYDYGSRLAGDVTNRFPSAAKELTHSGNSFAVAEYTASVFHSMRAVEIALHALHACLGITVPLINNDRNWGNIANRIREAINSRGNTWAEKDLFQEFYVTIVAVKDGWRNPTMHVETNYTEDDAERIFRAVKDVIEKISSRMDENGLPLA